MNIQLDQVSPFTLIDRYMSCATTAINNFYTVPPAGLKGKPIERMCYMSDYKIKLYDKSKQAKIAIKDLLRYEIVYTELRKIRQVLGYSKEIEVNLKMLNDINTWNKFFRHLMMIYDSIKKIPLQKEPIPIDDIFDIHCYCNKILADDIKNSMNINTYNKVRAELKRVYNYYNQQPQNYHILVRERLTDKFDKLTKVQQFQYV